MGLIYRKYFSSIIMNEATLRSFERETERHQRLLYGAIVALAVGVIAGVTANQLTAILEKMLG